jgi:hypothetical protein
MKEASMTMSGRTASTALRVTPWAVFGALLAAAAAAVLLLPGGASAQGGTTFTATITNATNPEQIITPGAYLVHSSPGAFWSGGASANLGLERIAEIGDPGEAVASLGATALDPIPANGDSITFEFIAMPGDLFSSAQMLIGTNDGFVGAESVALFQGDAGRTFTLNLMGYDAGTEENAPLFSGFDAGQPDPDQGAANLDNGTVTSESIAPLDLVSGTQATLSIEASPVPTLLTPPDSGNAGLNLPGGGTAAWQLLALAAIGGAVLGAAVWTRRSA